MGRLGHLRRATRESRRASRRRTLAREWEYADDRFGTQRPAGAAAWREAALQASHRAHRGFFRVLPLLTVIVVVAGVMAAPSSAFGATQIEWGWGQKGAGQLGDGTASSYRDPPVPGVQGVAGLAAGQGFSLALMKDGTVTAWGFNNPGLGDGKSTFSYVPVQVSGLSGVTAIAAGRFHGVALRGDGTVVAWGSNGRGQLGDGTTIDRTVPVPVSGLSGGRAIAAGGDDSLALLEDGTVMAWGQNQGGQLGDGTTIDSDVPVAVHGLSDVRAI